MKKKYQNYLLYLYSELQELPSGKELHRVTIFCNGMVAGKYMLINFEPKERTRESAHKSDIL